MLSSFLRKISITKSKSICDRELLNSSPTDNDQSLLTKAIVLAPLKKLFPISTKLLTIALVAFALNAYSEGSDDKGSDKREVKFKAIAAGDLRSLALSKDGKVYVAGSNRFGQLGLGDSDHETNRHTFTEVTSLSAKTIVAISVGGFHSL
ncbi:MAG: hypothetical protein LBF86_06025, partial [Helicobacteraceae bacterium]|nr:hypothetical protein [Helicobacteraceae bacterium]